MRLPGRQSLLPRVLLGVLILAAIGGLIMILSPALGEALLFQPSKDDPGPPPPLAGVRGESLRLVTSDGVGIHAWWYRVGMRTGPFPEDGERAVLFLHGNAGNISHRVPIARGLLEEGLSVLLLEYRGYGGSEGSPSEEGLHRDAGAGHAFLRREGIEPEKIFVFGRSMGGAVAGALVAVQPSGGLILESSFTSLEAMARSLYPFLPRFLFRRLRGRFDTLGRVTGLDLPVLVIHGTEDDLVPLAMGEALFQAAGSEGVWLEVPGAGHNDVFWVGGETYFRAVADFIRRKKGGDSVEGASPP